MRGPQVPKRESAHEESVSFETRAVTALRRLDLPALGELFNHERLTPRSRHSDHLSLLKKKGDDGVTVTPLSIHERMREDCPFNRRGKALLYYRS